MTELTHNDDGTVVSDMSPTAMASPTLKKSKTPPKVLKNSTFVRSNGEYMLSEPRTGQAFNPGVIVEVSEITEWIQGNIDVGLFTHLEA